MRNSGNYTYDYAHTFFRIDLIQCAIVEPYAKKNMTIQMWFCYADIHNETAKHCITSICSTFHWRCLGRNYVTISSLMHIYCCIYRRLYPEKMQVRSEY